MRPLAWLYASLCLSLALSACTTTSAPSAPAERTPIASIGTRFDPSGEPLRAQIKDAFLARLHKRLYAQGGFAHGSDVIIQWKAGEWDESHERPFQIEATFTDASGKVLAHRFFHGWESSARNERALERVAPTGIVPGGPPVGLVGVSTNELHRSIQNTADDLSAFAFEHFSPAPR